MDAKDESAIPDIVGARARAVRERDVEGMMAAVAEDAVIYDVVDPLRREGRGSSHARAAEWVAAFDGPIGWENGELHVAASTGVAFSHALSQVTGALKTGVTVDMLLRTTLGFQRRAGRWLITHDHGSVPMNPESGKGSFDLKP